MAGNAKLTEIKIRTAKAREKSYKLADGGGLYLLVATDGTRYWRYNYRFHGAYRTMSFGIYPEVSAKAAREQHQEARLKLAAGVDPMAERKLQKLTAREEAERDFETIARQMWADQRAAGRSKGVCRLGAGKVGKRCIPVDRQATDKPDPRSGDSRHLEPGGAACRGNRATPAHYLRPGLSLRNGPRLCEA